MGKAWTRRDFLSSLGVGSVALAGCTTDGQHTGTRSDFSRTVPGSTASDTQTSSSETTRQRKSKSADEWRVDPVEHDKRIGAYYYGWYGPDYAAKYDGWLTQTPGDDPVLGQYDQDNDEVVNQHIKWALEHGINWFKIDWARRGMPNTSTFIEEQFLPTELGSEIGFSIVYAGTNLERTASGTISFENNANRDRLHRDFAHFEENYFQEPNYMRIDDRPVVTFYTANDFVDAVEAFDEATASISADPYLIASVLDARSLTGILTELKEPSIVEVFDAATGYTLFDSEIVESGGYRGYIDWCSQELKEWALAADAVSLDYIPSVLPGLNDTHIDSRPEKYQHPILERDSNGFQELGAIAYDRMDPDLDAVVITSFNEWPEYTAVEPSVRFGTTYLEIIEEELVRETDPEYFEPDRYVTLALRFQRTVPAPENAVEFGMMMDSLEFQTAESETVVRYNIGLLENEPYLLEGAFPPKQTPDDEHAPYDYWRWLGGPTKQATLFLPPEYTRASHVEIQGNAPPFAESSISVEVYFDGAQTDVFELRPDPKVHVVSLQQ